MRNFKKYCKDYENIENYEKAKADNFIGWCCHHRKGFDISAAELKALGMYYNRPAEELIFLTKREHRILHNKGEHNPMYGKQLSEEARKKIGEVHKGNKNMLGKKHSEESKKKMSEAKKGKPKTEEHKKKLSEAKKGHIVSGEVRNKISKARKNKCWFNNGKVNVIAKECPDGFVPGMLKRK